MKVGVPHHLEAFLGFGRPHFHCKLGNCFHCKLGSLDSQLEQLIGLLASNKSCHTFRALYPKATPIATGTLGGRLYNLQAFYGPHKESGHINNTSCPTLPLQLSLAATEQFNCKPKQGIWFLREQGYLRSPLEPGQLADFLLEMPGLVQQDQDWGLPGGQEERSSAGGICQVRICVVV